MNDLDVIKQEIQKNVESYILNTGEISFPTVKFIIININESITSIPIKF